MLAENALGERGLIPSNYVQVSPLSRTKPLEPIEEKQIPVSLYTGWRPQLTPTGLVASKET